MRTYVAVDGGMIDNPRPAMYGSEYEAFLPRAVDAERTRRVRVVGKHCESGDIVVDKKLTDERFGGYLARKQTHIHKLAMILAAAESDRLVITAEHLALAHTMVTDLEPDMQFVFSKIGKSEDSLYIERLIWYVHKRGGCPWTEAYRFVHTYFPKISDFEAVITGAIRAGYLVLQQQGSVMMLLPGANTPDGLDTEGKGP